MLMILHQQQNTVHLAILISLSIFKLLFFLFIQIIFNLPSSSEKEEEKEERR